MTNTRAKEKRAEKNRPPDEFDIDWELIKSVNDQESEKGRETDAGSVSTAQEMFLSFTGCDKESLQENGESYNLTYYEKFHIFVEALV